MIKRLLTLMVLPLILNLMLSAQVQNPILPGFYPDPSICKVENDYYLINSSFSYFPGIPIFHSTDLVHWKQIGHILDRPAQLNISNQGMSRGIFAPALNYHDGLFYMITTFIDGINNFYLTAKNPAGPWSDPKRLPGIDGIDPSFFFDDNGKAYIVNNGPPPDNKPLYNGHRALWLQEFDINLGRPTGPRRIILNGGIDLSKKPVWIEGPHIYKRKAYYYLMAAEGGTSTWHSEVILRSKNIWGPYEVFEGNPILTQRDLPPDRPNPITSAGHADLVETPSGGWAAVFLACRPYEDNYYNTGRETFILPVDWSGEWPVILEGGLEIPLETSIPGVEVVPEQTFSYQSSDWTDEFTGTELGFEWIFIRTPKEKWYELMDNAFHLIARPVKLNQYGNPSFIGRRQQHQNAQFQTALALSKEDSTEAGIVAFQNDEFFYKFTIKQEGKAGTISVSKPEEEIFSTTLENYKRGKKIHLRIKVLGDKVFFEYSWNKKNWKQAGPVQDARYLSTEIAGGFIGTVFGLYGYASSPSLVIFENASYKEIFPE